MKKVQKLFLLLVLVVIVCGTGVFIFLQMNRSEEEYPKSKPLSIADKLLRRDDDLENYMEANYKEDGSADTKAIREDLLQLKERYPYFSYAILDDFESNVLADRQDEDDLHAVYGKVSWDLRPAYEDEELNRCIADAKEAATPVELENDPELEILRKRLYFLKQHYPEESYEELKEKIEEKRNQGTLSEEFSMEERYIVGCVHLDEEVMEYVDSLIPDADPEELKQDPNLDDLKKILYVEHNMHQYLSYEELTEVIYTEGRKVRTADDLTTQELESFKKAMKEQGIDFVG